MTNETLTGRKRHIARSYGFGPRRKVVLVLQVEAKGLHTYCAGGMVDSEWVTYWRDAHTGDVTVEAS